MKFVDDKVDTCTDVSGKLVATLETADRVKIEKKNEN